MLTELEVTEFEQNVHVRMVLSYSKVRLVSRVATAENEAALIDIALRHPANRLGIELAAYLRKTEPGEDRRL